MHSQASSKAGRPPVAKKFNCKVSANRGIAGSGIGGRRLTRSTAVSTSLASLDRACGERLGHGAASSSPSA